MTYVYALYDERFYILNFKLFIISNQDSAFVVLIYTIAGTAFSKISHSL